MPFIESYFKMVENTESPFAYHQWSCLSTLSALAGRRFWFKLGPFWYYPNLYCVLVGHPGVKKSAAMDRAKDIVRAVGGTKEHHIPIAATQATKEFIAKAMSHEKFPGKRYFRHGDETIEYNQYAIFATELTQFIAVNPLGMIDFLTTVYTERVYNCDTKGQGSDLVMGPYITLLACMTPEIVKGFLKQNILTGGFARRTVFVYGLGGSIIPFPSYTQEQKDAMEACVLYGKKMQDWSGEFVMDKEATQWYNDWYIHLHKNITDISKPNTEGYYRTKHEILFKISMLIALSEGPELVLRVSHFKIAEMFFKPVEANLERVFEGAGINPNAQAASQVCRMLEALDRPFNRKMLEGMFYDQVTSLNELRDMLTHLVSVGKLQEKNVIVNGNLAGTLIGTVAAMQRYPDTELYQFLKQRPPNEPK